MTWVERQSHTTKTQPPQSCWDVWMKLSPTNVGETCCQRTVCQSLHWSSTSSFGLSRNIKHGLRSGESRDLRLKAQRVESTDRSGSRWHWHPATRISCSFISRAQQRKPSHKHHLAGSVPCSTGIQMPQLKIWAKAPAPPASINHAPPPDAGWSSPTQEGQSKPPQHPARSPLLCYNSHGSVCSTTTLPHWDLCFAVSVFHFLSPFSYLSQKFFQMRPCLTEQEHHP